MHTFQLNDAARIHKYRNSKPTKNEMFFFSGLSFIFPSVLAIGLFFSRHFLSFFFVAFFFKIKTIIVIWFVSYKPKMHECYSQLYSIESFSSYTSNGKNYYIRLRLRFIIFSWFECEYTI